MMTMMMTMRTTTRVWSSLSSSSSQKSSSSHHGGRVVDSRRIPSKTPSKSSNSSSLCRGVDGGNSGGFSTREPEDEDRDAKFARLFAETFENASSSESSESSSSPTPKNSLLELLEEEEIKEPPVSSLSSILMSSSNRLEIIENGDGETTAKASSSTSSTVIARWILVAKYGHKAECVKMLHEWADTVGRAAGLDPTRDILLVSGNIGANESTIELEIRNGLSSVGDFDQLMRNIDVTMHREWGMRFAEHVVDGTTRWEIFTTHPFVSGSSSTSSNSSNRSNSKYSRPGVSRTQPRRVLSPQKKTSTESRSSANGVRPEYEDIPEEELMKYIGKTLPDGRRVVENAFGVPMVINPGDIFFD